MNTTLLDKTNATRRKSWFLNLLPGLLRLNRVPLAAIAFSYLAISIPAFIVTSQVGHPRTVISADSVFNGRLYEVAKFGIFLPVLVAMFVGAPLLARLFDARVALFAWTQEVGRRRFVASSLLIFVLEIVALSIPTGIVVQRMSFNLYPQFPNGLWQQITFNAGPWTLTSEAILGLVLGTFIGVVLKRTVVAIALTLVAEVGFVFLGAMNWAYKTMQYHFAVREPFNFQFPPLSSVEHRFSTWQMTQVVASHDGSVHSVDWFYERAFALPPKWHALVSDHPLVVLNYLGLHGWTPVLYHAQAHGFLVVWCGGFLAISTTLVLAIFAMLRGRDRLFGR